MVRRGEAVGLVVGGPRAQGDAGEGAERETINIAF